MKVSGAVFKAKEVINVDEDEDRHDLIDTEEEDNVTEKAEGMLLCTQSILLC